MAGKPRGLTAFASSSADGVAVAGAAAGGAAAASVTVTPAAIVLLGDRVDSLDLRRGIRRMLGRPQPAQQAIRQTFWYGWTKAAMRHTLPISLVTIAVLLVLGAPFLGVKWGYPDDRVLPTSASAREIAAEPTLRTRRISDPNFSR